MFKVLNEIDYKLECDAIVIALFENKKVLEGIGKELDDHLENKLTELIKDGDLSGSKKEISKVHTFGSIGPKRIYTVGLGNSKKITRNIVREAIGNLYKRLRKDKMESVIIGLDTFLTDRVDVQATAKIIGEAYPMATYTFEGYKTINREHTKELQTVNVITDQAIEEIEAQIFTGYAYGQGVNSARTLVNTPGNLLTATDLADYAVSIAKRYGMEYEILEKEDMEKLGMGALLAVNKGSVEPPKMIVLKYRGKDKWEDVIGLVGKGITFDTGGYSLKPKDGIVGMKSDMGGAAAVLGAMEVIGQLQPKQNVVAVIPSTDNMISGEALKPDDVITSMNGKTIEVLNTDAEGRLALADGITYAKQLGANYLVDVATLTGGVVVALGDCTTGAMTNNEELFEELLQASHEVDEPIWLLPMFEVYKEKVRSSKIADLNNSPGREAHPIMAGAFIGEFAENTPWVHLDIAGTATTKADHDLGPSGATGVMVRTLTAFVENYNI